MLIKFLYLLLSISLLQGQFTFTAVDTNLRFQYPAGWRVTIEESSSIRVSNSNSAITIYPPGVLNEDRTDSLEALTAFATNAAIGTPLQVASGDQSEIAIGDITANRYDFVDDDGDTIPLFIVERSLSESGSPVFILTIGPTSEIEAATLVALEIARTIHHPSPMPAALEYYDADWQQTILELEQYGLIETGGELIFTDGRALFLGEDDWVTLFSPQNPRSNIVMAGTLRFRPGNIGEEETCGLISRVITDSEGEPSAWLNVGIDNDHEVYYADRLNRVQQINSVIMPGFDLEAVHHYLMVVQNDTLTVYVDGRLVIQQATITSRSGSYGVALEGHGPDALCEGLNIWAYSLPSSAPQACIISTSRPANKRGGPSTGFAQVGRLERGTIQNAIAQIVGRDGFTWWQLDDESWVRSDVVSNQGDCAGLPSP